MDIAQQIVMQVAQGDFAAVEQRLAYQFKAVISTGAIQATWQGLEQQFGAFQGLGKTTAVQTPQGLEQVVTCVFERASVDVKIVLNGAGEITGFTMTPDYPPYNPSGPYPGRNPYQQPQRPRKRSGGLGCLLWLALFFLLFGGAWLLEQSLQTNQLFVFFYSKNFIIMEAGGFVLMVVFVILSGVKGHTVLGKPLKVVALAMLAILVVNTLLFGTFNPQIDLTRSGFSIPSVTIARHHKVTFDNPSDGVTQILCLGTDQQCDPNAGGPPQLAQGLVIHPGQSVSVIFDGWGHYNITSKTTPHRNLSIDVLRCESKQRTC